MENTQRLTFLREKSYAEIDELWENVFQGKDNLNHMNAHMPYPLTQHRQLSGFLLGAGGYRTWLIKRIHEQDIIGFAIHGDYIPGLPNNIGFNIGLRYTRNGYATEALGALLDHLRDEGHVETFGHCFETNTASVRTMESCGFQNLGRTGNVYGGRHELQFRYAF